MGSTNDYYGYEHFEGVFDQYLKQAERGRFPVYQATKNFLTFTHHDSWRTYLLSLSAFYFALESYLNYRQYLVLKRTSPPKVLQNVITREEFSKSQAHDRAAIKFKFWSGLYRLSITFLLVTSEVLPYLWIHIDKLRWNNIDRHYLDLYELSFGHTLNCPLFYIACSFLWTTLMLPSTFWEHCVLGIKPKFEKETVHEWISDIIKEQISIFVKVWLLIWLHEQQILESGVEAAYHTAFYTLCWGWLILVAYVLFLLPFVPFRLFKFSPLTPGKTKSAIESLARDLKFPLGSIYTCPSRKRSQAQSDLLVFGPPWSRNIAISDSVLERCSTEEVVALIACEIGSWKHNNVQQIATGSFSLWMQALSIWTLLFNWQAVCRAFGFAEMYIFAGQHPFQIVVLILGGALDPVFNAIDVCINAACKVFESDADKFASKKGHGPQLARALIKMSRGEIDIAEADWAYLKFCGNGHLLLSERLKALGWTEEEKIFRRR